MSARNIIVIGASAGGFDALQRLAAQFPPNFQASIFVTLHLVAKSDGLQPALLSRAGPLPALHPSDGQRIEAGRIYLAPPDYHLLLRPGHIELGHGPRENLQRPSINAMFRSAAAAYGDRVAGVLLSGLLDDGAAGLWEIQQHGGATVVQDPEEAAFPAMPQNAICGLPVQYILRLAEMGPLLAQLNGRDANGPPLNVQQPAAEPAHQTCPECGGVMTVAHMGGLREYRCHTGHRFGLQSMIAEKSRVLEYALGSALAQSEELTPLLESAILEAVPGNAQILSAELAERRREQGILRELFEKRKSRVA